MHDSFWHHLSRPHGASQSDDYIGSDWVAPSSPKAFTDYQAGKLIDTEYSSAEVVMALAGLPSVG